MRLPAIRPEFMPLQEVIPVEANRVYNFNPGPAMQPLEVLKEAQAEFLNFEGTGESILEISHRAKEFETVLNQAKADIKELMGLGEDYDVLFLQGGASTQFAMIPMNFAVDGKVGSYILSGSFAKKAYEEAELLGVGHVAASSQGEDFRRVPAQNEIQIAPNAAYLHICYNNTIYGTEYHYIPDTGDLPLIADMSSDMLSRPLDFKKFAFIYAGAQKNLGPAGVTIVVARRELLAKSPKNIPTMLRYAIHLDKNSLYNTPPAFCIYMVGKTVAWIKAQGGLAAMAERNAKKAALLYNAIDDSEGFYRGHAAKDSRSFMNVTFRLPTEELEKKFVDEAKKEQLYGVKGHRSVGGMRASIYNAMPYEGVQKLADFMKQFRIANA